jgi:hypothetical protein
MGLAAAGEVLVVSTGVGTGGGGCETWKRSKGLGSFACVPAGRVLDAGRGRRTRGRAKIRN